MILQTLAMTQEDAALIVQEFVTKYLPQYAPFVEKWIGVILGVLAGLSLLISLIASLVKFFKSKNELKAAVTPYQMKDEIISTMKTDVLDRLQGTFDVDITDKLNPLINDVVANTNKDIALINQKVDAIVQAQAAITKVMANAGSLTEVEYKALKDALATLPQTTAQIEAPAHVQFALGEAKEEKKSHKIAV